MRKNTFTDIVLDELTLSLGPIPPLEQYLHDNSKLLPDLSKIRKKRAGSDDEDSSNQRTSLSEQNEPLKKKPRTEIGDVDLTLWSGDDIDILNNIDPELIIKIKKLSSDLKENVESIKKDYLSAIIQNINDLFERVSSENAKKQIYEQLEGLQDVVKSLTGMQLHIEPTSSVMSITGSRERQQEFSAYIKPSGWPDRDWETMKIKYPDIVRSLSSLRYDIKRKRKITQARLSGIDNRLHDFIHLLSSEIARNEILSFMEEMHRCLHLMNNPLLHLRPLPDLSEGSITQEVSPHLKADINKWSEEERIQLVSIFPDFEIALDNMISRSVMATITEQQEMANFYTNLQQLWTVIKTDVAKNDIFKIMQYILKNIPQNIIQQMNLQKLPDYRFKAIYTVSLRPSRWGLDDRRRAESIFPDMVNKIYSLKKNIRKHAKISHERLYEAERNLHLLWESLTSEEAKFEVYHTLKEIRESLPASGNVDLEMGEPPAYQPSLSSHRPEIKFSMSIHPSKWTADDIRSVNSIFPDIVKKLSHIRNDMIHKKVSDERLQVFGERCHTLWSHLNGEVAISEFRDMYHELKDNISLFTSNRIKLRELESLSVRTWLMTDFTQRNAGMADTWLAEDKKILQTVAPSLMYDLRELEIRKDIQIKELEKMEQKLTQMMGMFQGESARATIQSIRDSMYRYFSDKYVDVPKNIHVLSSRSSENIYSEPLKIMSSMADTLTIWIDSVNFRYKILQGIISKIVRIRFINEKISEIQNREGPSSVSKDERHINLLQRYRKLMSQQNPDTKERLSLLHEIKSESELSHFIRRVEVSLPFHTNKILQDKNNEWGDFQHPEQQNNLQQYVDKYKYDEITVMTRSFLLHHSTPKIITGLPENLKVRELSDVLKNNSLYQRLNLAHYTFDDRDVIIRFLLNHEGMQGMFTSEYNPPLSDEVISFLEQYLGDELSKSSSVYKALLQTVELRLEKTDIPFDVSPPSSIQPEQIESFQALTMILSLIPVEQWFRKPEWKAPVLSGSIRFSTDGKSLTDKAFISSIDKTISQDSSFIEYIEMIFNIQQDALSGKLTEDSIIKKLEKFGLTGDIYNERSNNLFQNLSSNPWKSITQINSLLRGTDSMAKEWLLWNSEKYSVMKSVLPYLNDISHSGEFFVHEEHVGIRYREKMQHETSSSDRPKYTLLSWQDFYSDHARLWHELAMTHNVTKTEFHPQSIIFSNEGRCMGITLLYLNSIIKGEYDNVKKNILTAGGLQRIKDSIHLPITLQDDKFLTDTLNIIDILQSQGNSAISDGSIFKKMQWSESILSSFFDMSGVTGVLVTTPSHSLALQYFNNIYRVTDPNFGHADFLSLPDAYRFIESSVQLTHIIRLHYGVSENDVHHRISVYDVSSSFHSVLSDSNIGEYVYITSQEKMSSRTEQLLIAENSITWRLLFDIGACIAGSRISEKTLMSELPEMTIHGDILREYLSRTVLNQQQVDNIRNILYAFPPEPGILPVNPDSIYATPVDISTNAFRIKQQALNTMRKVTASFNEIADAFDKVRLSFLDASSIIKIHLPDINNGVFFIEIKNDDRLIYKFSVDMSDIVNRFISISRMFSGITDSGIFDFELGLNVAGIIQYSRLVDKKQAEGFLPHLNVALDIKQLAESTLGSMIQVAGNKIFNPEGLHSFRIETWLANNLRKAASYSGNTIAQALNACAHLLDLPILESISGIWGLYSSISELQQARQHSDIMSSRVKVAFDSISLSLTFASIVFPPLIMAAGPVAAIGMGAVSIAKNIASKEERHEQWLKCLQFLTDGSRNIVVADPDNGVIDCSGNMVLGEMFLDLRNSKPILGGQPSFNSNKKIGHNHKLDDWQIRQRLGYGYNFMPSSSLARGYANSQWPEHLPSIPEGEYNTVILGYGRQFRVNTDIEYLSNLLAWREVIYEPYSRYSLPTFEILSQECTVICGKNNTTLIPVRVLSDLTQERIKYAMTFKDYTFYFSGGAGGITVQLGGCGIYNINADPLSESNVLSFRGLPDKFDLEYDLSIEKQSIMVEINGETIPVMTISQTGINTIVATTSGKNVLRGNSFNNTFHMGFGGGDIYSGGGKNKYIVSKKITSSINIYIQDGSECHDIILSESNLSDIEISGFKLLIKNNECVSVNIDDISVYSFRINIYTNDGFMLTLLTDHSNFVISFCDLERWKLCHSNEDANPVSILIQLSNFGWQLDKTVSFRENDLVALYLPSSQNMIWQLSNSPLDVIFTGSNFCKMTIYGSCGARYILRSDDAIVFFYIELYGDINNPEIIDLRDLVPDIVTVSKNDDLIRLNVYHDNKIIYIDIMCNDNVNGTWVYLSSNKNIKIGDIIILINISNRPVIIYQATQLSSVNKIICVNNNSSINTFIPALSNNQEIILCLENSGWTEKTVNIKILSGQLKKNVNVHTDLLGVKIRPYTKEYLIFSGEDNISLTGVIYTQPLMITSSGSVVIPEYRWKSVESIVISPKEEAPTVKLINFIRYELPLENKAIKDTMYYPGFIKVKDRDITIKFLYLLDGVGVKTLDITLKNYFTKRIYDISNPESLIATTPLLDSRLVNRKYHWKLIYLGDKPLSIVGIVSFRNYHQYRLRNNI